MDFNKNKKSSVCAIILAAGSGSRMKSNKTKQQMLIKGKSVLYRSVNAFENANNIDSIVIVTKDGEEDFVKAEVKDFKKVKKITLGGKCRAESAKNGFLSIPEGTDAVLIHDGARCLIKPEMIDKIVDSVLEKGAATAVSLVTDTIKEVDSNGKIVSTHNREFLRRAATPQGFRTEIYKKALDAAVNLENITDDNMLVENINIPVYCVDIGFDNIKITTPQDLLYAEFLLSQEENND